jgi:hypothetical protein
MQSLLISANAKADLNILIELAKRLGLTSKILTEEELEEIGLLKAMEEGRKTKFVPRTEIMKTLQKNAK